MMLINVYKLEAGIVEVSDCRFIRIRISSITCICIRNRQKHVRKDFWRVNTSLNMYFKK